MVTFPELLSVKGLGKTFLNGGESKRVLHKVDFEVSSHESLAIVGPSGCGKTTLLLLLSGLLSSTEGMIALEGEPVSGPTHKVALVLQEYGLFPWKTVAENVTLGARFQKIKVPAEELVSLKKELGIEGLDALYPHQLSGGQRQRVALARALLLRPRLLLLDEPFAALDAITRERLQNHLLNVFVHRRFSFIIVTHNIEEAIFLGRRVSVLDPRIAGIRGMIDNPEAGSPDYRNHPEFFRRSLALRQMLEEMT